MHNGARRLSIYRHQCSQAIPALAIKACGLAWKSQMLNFCEGMRGLCPDMLWLWLMGTDNAGHKIFCLLEKKSKAKNKRYNNVFRNVVIYSTMPDALRDLHTSKYKRPRNKPDDGCLWKRAKRDNVRTSKQLRFVACTETFKGNQALGYYSNIQILRSIFVSPYPDLFSTGLMNSVLCCCIFEFLTL